MNCSGVVIGMKLLLDLVNINVRDFGVLSIEDLGQFLKSWATGLDVEEVDEEEFQEDPDL